jgi:predicted nucleic acid-binding protein
VSFVLDASMALAWQFKRADPVEIELAEKALAELDSTQAVVPAIWYVEVANGVLRGERQGVIPPAQTAFFLNELSQAEIVADGELPRTRQTSVMALARMYSLTAYDATYLELAMRSGACLATFDRKLAAAARAAGVRVFGDPL